MRERSLREGTREFCLRAGTRILIAAAALGQLLTHHAVIKLDSVTRVCAQIHVTPSLYGLTGLNAHIGHL